MKIKFTGLAPEVRGTSNGMLLQGIKTYDDTPYEKFFWHEAKNGAPTDLGKIAKSLQPGQLLELKYDDSKFKNLQSIDILDGSSAAASSGTSKSAAGAGNRNTGKSNYRDPDHTDRSSAMYLAWEITKSMNGITDGKKPAAVGQSSITAQFEDLSKKLEGFLHTGEFVCPQEPGQDADTPEENAQPAGDGAGDDDDIPF